VTFIPQSAAGNAFSENLPSLSVSTLVVCRLQVSETLAPEMGAPAGFFTVPVTSAGAGVDPDWAVAIVGEHEIRNHAARMNGVGVLNAECEDSILGKKFDVACGFRKQFYSCRYGAATAVLAWCS
jgi:hypothetical protein